MDVATREDIHFFARRVVQEALVRLQAGDAHHQCSFTACPEPPPYWMRELHVENRPRTETADFTPRLPFSPTGHSHHRMSSSRRAAADLRPSSTRPLPEHYYASSRNIPAEHDPSPRTSSHSASANLQLWDTGGMERVASVTSSYYKFAEAAVLVFSLDNPDSFNILSQHLLDIVSYAENAKIFLCGNKVDLVGRIYVSEADIEAFCEQCHNLMSGVYRTSCKTGQGIEEMFTDIARQLVMSCRVKDLDDVAKDSFKVTQPEETQESCSC
ncbi:hypothetical protein HPB51_019487 [Rhipicephalus microplus]|uniref:Uncharacterized protein n=1 Tax=Rhipicephalus microplus TaxID=6941 RepID=A0A9J6DBW4_RHIMP|nr:hypothetical protein HPB51_019487 [Rhipicephalus microplus]